MAALFLVCILGSFFAVGHLDGFHFWSDRHKSEIAYLTRVFPSSEDRDPIAVYQHGYMNKVFYDVAYGNVASTPPAMGETEGEMVGERAERVKSAVVAHHLLIPEKIADIFLRLASDDVKTVVLVSPNHFSLGVHAAQVSEC